MLGTCTNFWAIFRLGMTTIQRYLFQHLENYMKKSSSHTFLLVKPFFCESDMFHMLNILLIC